MNGERLKELREDMGITQTKLAEIVGTGKHSVSTWERNLAEPGDDYKIILAKYFDVSLDYLCGLTDDRKPGVRRSGEKIELFLPPDFPQEGVDDLKKFFEFLIGKYSKK